jgi:hypothetical protein
MQPSPISSKVAVEQLPALPLGTSRAIATVKLPTGRKAQSEIEQVKPAIALGRPSRIEQPRRIASVLTVRLLTIVRIELRTVLTFDLIFAINEVKFAISLRMIGRAVSKTEETAKRHESRIGETIGRA